MARCRVLAPLLVEAEGETYMPGSTVELDEGAAAALEARGVVAAADAGAARAGRPCAEPAPDLSPLYEAMTRDQMMQAAQVRGLDVPKRATKAQIAAILGGR